LHLENLFKGFHLLHVALLTLAAIGFFMFWARTRFWLPRYVHFLAAIGLAVSLWGLTTTPDDAPINQQGPIAKLLLALALPAMVYFFFVFYGGQRAAFERRLTRMGPCPYCNQPVAYFHNGDSATGEKRSSLEKQCASCSVTLPASWYEPRALPGTTSALSASLR